MYTYLNTLKEICLKDSFYTQYIFVSTLECFLLQISHNFGQLFVHINKIYIVRLGM